MQEASNDCHSKGVDVGISKVGPTMSDGRKK